MIHLIFVAVGQVAQIQKEIDAQRDDYAEEWENESDFWLFHLWFPGDMVGIWPDLYRWQMFRNWFRVLTVQGATTPHSLKSLLNKQMGLRTRGDKVTYFWCIPTDIFVLGVSYEQFGLALALSSFDIHSVIQYRWLSYEFSWIQPKTEEFGNPAPFNPYENQHVLTKFGNWMSYKKFLRQYYDARCQNSNHRPYMRSSVRHKHSWSDLNLVVLQEFECQMGLVCSLITHLFRTSNSQSPSVPESKYAG